MTKRIFLIINIVILLINIGMTLLMLSIHSPVAIIPGIGTVVTGVNVVLIWGTRDAE